LEDIEEMISYQKTYHQSRPSLRLALTRTLRYQSKAPLDVSVTVP